MNPERARELSKRLNSVRSGDVPADLKRALKTHEGRMAYIRTFRERMPPDEVTASLADAAAVGESHPVFWLIPETAGVIVYSRGTLLEFLDRRENNPELWDLLKQQSHPSGTVFYFLAWGPQHSFIQTVLIRGGPQDN
jgi:hypothetical protein